MVTARVLVTDALDLLGVHAAEESLSAHQEQQGLRVLNDLIRNVSLEQFLIYYMAPQTVSWPAGAPLRLWGPGGDIEAPRPVQIGAQASVLDPVTQRVMLLTVYSMAEFRQITNPLLQADPLRVVAYAPALPLGELHGWPIPTQAIVVTVYPWHVLQAWPAFDDDVLLPPGYDRFLKSAVAVDLAPFYDKEPTPTVLGMRAEAKNNVKTTNVTIPLLDVPWFADPYGPRSGSL